MFYLYTIKDSIIISPNEIDSQNLEKIILKLQEKYLFKIIPNEGMCVQILNYQHIEAKILQQEGELQIHLIIEMILFRTFREELLEGIIIQNNIDGILVSLEFTNAFIPADLLNNNSFYDSQQKIWIWPYEDSHAFFYENLKIRFKTNQVLLNKNQKVDDYFIIGKCNEDGLGPLNWWEQ